MCYKKCTSLAIITLALSLSATPLSFADKSNNNKEQNIVANNKSFVSENSDTLNVNQLIETRDQLINKNLEGLNEFGQDIVQDRKSSILNFDFGLVAYIDKTYSNLTEKEKLIKQIEIIEYLNSINEIMDPSGNFFESANEMYQISQYLIKNGKSPNYSDSYESLNFLIDNLQDLCDFVDYDEENVVARLDPLIKPSLPENQKLSLDEDLKEVYLEDNLSDEVKNAVKELQDTKVYYQNNTDDSLVRTSQASLRTTQSSYRQNALAYARKHGYTNGYYGSSNSKNPAPSPYYNFWRDGHGDCANFVSQCLSQGGVQFWKNNNPWYYYSVNNRSSSWAGAKQFKIHWVNRIAYQTLTVKDTLSFLQPATPISICDKDGVATHTLITTDKHSNGYNFSYAAHTDEGTRTNLLSKLKGKKISYYKVYW